MVVTRLPSGGTRVVRARGGGGERGERRNDGTVIAGIAEIVGAARLRRPLEDEHEWSAVFARLGTWRAEQIERDVLAVVVRTQASDGTARFEVVLAASDGAPHALIVGRHDLCDVVLPTDGGASLRQAAVLLWPGASGAAPRVVVVDLQTSRGLATRHGRPVRRMSSETALHFGAGNADVYVLVAAADRPFSVQFADQLDAHVMGALVDEDVPPLQPKRAASSPAPTFTDWEKSVVFRTGHTQAVLAAGLVIPATPADLAHGVVLGRYERCHRTEAIATRDVVSRVHALLFVSGDTPWIVDTASTAGTYIVDTATRIETELGEGHRIARLTPSCRVFLADVEVQIDAAAGLVR